MRSIGKVKIKKLQKIVQEEYQRQKDTFYIMSFVALNDSIRERIPNEWYDLHETAYQEINRICDDEIANIRRP